MRARGIFSALLTGLALALAALAAPALADYTTLTGTVNYLDRFDFPRGSRLEVELIDAGRAKPLSIASIQKPVEGRAPFGFTLGYDDLMAAAGGPHLLKARIWLGEVVAFRSDRAVTVRLGEATADPEIILRRVVLKSGDGSAVGRRWRALRLEETEAIPSSSPMLELTTDGFAVGRTGCNDFRGRYELAEPALTFGRLAITKRGCMSDLAEQEDRFLRLMRLVRSYRVLDGRLYLLSGGGLELMVFEPDG